MMDDINNQKVIFKEGDPRIAQRFSRMEGGNGFHNVSSDDRVVNLIIKISGGRVKSKNIATLIGLFLTAIMFIISIIWFIKAFSGPTAI